MRCGSASSSSCCASARGRFFSDAHPRDDLATLLFNAAADFCAERVNDPFVIADLDGLFPLPADFH
jgi:hypothetical protein